MTHGNNNKQRGPAASSFGHRALLLAYYLVRLATWSLLLALPAALVPMVTTTSANRTAPFHEEEKRALLLVLEVGRGGAGAAGRTEFRVDATHPGGRKDVKN